VGESKYGKYIVSKLRTDLFDPKFNALYAKWATRILWMDDRVVDGAFQINCSWYFSPPTDESPLGSGHSHDCDEILGFFGSNPDDPYDLGGEIEFWLEDEQHIITSSSLIFIPRGMKHCPLIMRRIDRPIFHFSTVTGGQYEQIKASDKA
jgi:hypothetical protein